jgi:hypothetical protein
MTTERERQWMREYMRKRRAAEYAARPADWKDGRRREGGPDPQAQGRAMKRWRERHPKQARAYTLLHAAVRRGKIARPECCEYCGRNSLEERGAPLEGHHEDYNRPLDVIWLCDACHDAIHISPPFREKVLSKVRPINGGEK